MTLTRQTRFGAPTGNCFNACVATLLDLPLEKVDVIWDETNWLKQLDAILHPLGYCFAEWNWEGAWTWMGNCYVIASGDGPRGCKHSVIMRHCVTADGRHCLINHWDPHPSDGFLKKIDYVGVLFPHWEKTGELSQ